MTNLDELMNQLPEIRRLHAERSKAARILSGFASADDEKDTLLAIIDALTSELASVTAERDAAQHDEQMANQQFASSKAAYEYTPPAGLCFTWFGDDPGFKQHKANLYGLPECGDRNAVTPYSPAVKYDMCPRCYPTPPAPAPAPTDEPCDVCGGSGELECRDCRSEGERRNSWGDVITCEWCDGVGRRECRHCKGTGKLELSQPPAEIPDQLSEAARLEIVQSAPPVASTAASAAPAKLTKAQRQALEIAKRAADDNRPTRGSNYQGVRSEYYSWGHMKYYAIYRATGKALLKKGLLSNDKGDFNITDAGRAALEGRAK